MNIYYKCGKCGESLQVGRESVDHECKQLYMNLATGSIDTYDGWWYHDITGNEVNAVDEGEVVEIKLDKNGEIIRQ